MFGGSNVYGYAFGNPTTQTDPDGLIATLPLAAIGAVIGGVAAAASVAINDPHASVGTIAAAVGVGILAGAINGLTLGAASAAVPGGALGLAAIIEIGAAGGTGALSGAGGEAIGEALTNGVLNPSRIGTAALIGSLSGAGSLMLSGLISPTAALGWGSLSDLLFSPAVANASELECQ